MKQNLTREMRCLALRWPQPPPNDILPSTLRAYSSASHQLPPITALDEPTPFRSAQIPTLSTNNVPPLTQGSNQAHGQDTILPNPSTSNKASPAFGQQPVRLASSSTLDAAPPQIDGSRGSLAGSLAASKEAFFGRKPSTYLTHSRELCSSSGASPSTCDQAIKSHIKYASPQPRASIHAKTPQSRQASTATTPHIASLRSFFARQPSTAKLYPVKPPQKSFTCPRPPPHVPPLALPPSLLETSSAACNISSQLAPPMQLHNSMQAVFSRSNVKLTFGGQSRGYRGGVGEGHEGEEWGVQRAKVLVTGAGGQIGSEFVPFLRDEVGMASVIASDVKAKPSLRKSGPFVYGDVTNKDHMNQIVVTHGITRITHLAAVLSAVGEQHPMRAMEVNLAGTHNVLEIAREHNVEVFAPSTIAVFGPTSPKHMTPDDTVLNPTTVYGITKVHQELMGQYYANRYGLDYRSLRFPGIVSYMTMPGGGTTDFAVEIFHEALKRGKYTCYLSPHTALPLQYMPDSLKAMSMLCAAPRAALSRCTYNVAGISVTPARLADLIKRYIPNFEITYQPDFRQEIADSWPTSLDDTLAQKEWGWQNVHTLEDMVHDMLRECAVRYYPEKLPELKGVLETEPARMVG